MLPHEIDVPKLPLVIDGLLYDNLELATVNYPSKPANLESYMGIALDTLVQPASAYNETSNITLYDEDCKVPTNSKFYDYDTDSDYQLRAYTSQCFVNSILYSA